MYDGSTTVLFCDIVLTTRVLVLDKSKVEEISLQAGKCNLQNVSALFYMLTYERFAVRDAAALHRLHIYVITSHLKRQ